MDIKTAILNGVSEDEIREDFERQMREANEMRKEKESKENIAEVRTNLVNAIFEYFNLLGLIPNGDNRDFIDEIANVLIESEKELSEMAGLLKCIEKFGDTRKKKSRADGLNVDEIIENFIKKL